MKKHIRFVALMIFFVSTYSLHGFEFKPSVVVYSSDGRGKNNTYEIYNNQKSKLAIELSAHERTIDPEGKEALKASDHFQFFPRQFSLGVGERRLVKVTYRGPKKIERENAYRIVAEQLNVSLSDPSVKKGITTQLKFLFRYQTSAFVTEPEFKPEVKIANWTIGSAAVGAQPSLNLKLENAGKAHRTFQDWELKIKTKNKHEVRLNKSKIKDWPIFNLLAESTRNISIIPNEPISDILSLELVFND